MNFEEQIHQKSFLAMPGFYGIKIHIKHVSCSFNFSLDFILIKSGRKSSEGLLKMQATGSCSRLSLYNDKLVNKLKGPVFHFLKSQLGYVFV